MKKINNILLIFFVILDIVFLIKHDWFNALSKLTAESLSQFSAVSLIIITILMSTLAFFVPTLLYSRSMTINMAYNNLHQSLSDRYKPNPKRLTQVLNEKGFKKAEGSFTLVIFMSIPIGLFIYNVVRYLPEKFLFSISITETNLYIATFVVAMYYFSMMYTENMSGFQIFFNISLVGFTSVILSSTSVLIAVYTFTSNILRLIGVYLGRQYVKKHKPVFADGELDYLTNEDGAGKKSQVTRLAESFAMSDVKSFIRSFKRAFLFYISFDFVMTLIVSFFTGTYFYLFSITIIVTVSELIRYRQWKIAQV